MEVGEEGDYVYLSESVHCHHQSHFNVSLTVRDKVTRLSKCCKRFRLPFKAASFCILLTSFPCVNMLLNVYRNHKAY